MFSTLEIPISLIATGTTFNSEVQKLDSAIRILGWEFTTPDYTNAVTLTLSVVSAKGNILLSSSAINEATLNVKTCATNEQVVVSSGFSLRAVMSNVTGSAHTFSVILHIDDGR
jgi:hypothetical protein